MNAYVPTATTAVTLAAHGVDARLGDASTQIARLRAFHTLDALRGAAAIAVVLLHVGFIYGVAKPAEAQVAVDLFFVMSGFIIAYRYDGDLRRGLGIGRFATIRLIRLYPLFLLGTLLGFLPALIAVSVGDKDVLYRELVDSLPLAVLMLPSHFTVPRIEELYPLNYVAWSLALEMVINIVYAATFRLWTVPRLVMIVGAGFAGLCACAAVYGNLKDGYAWFGAPVGMARVVYGFFAGVLIYRLHERRPFAVRVPWWILLGAVVAIFVFDPPFGEAAWEVFTVAVLSPAIVIGAVANEPPRMFRRACATAGVFSYVVYSLHAPFVGLFLRGEARSHLDIRAESPTKALVFTVLLAAVCVAAHVFYDKPVRRFLTGRLAAPAGRLSEPAAAIARR